MNRRGSYLLPHVLKLFSSNDEIKDIWNRRLYEMTLTWTNDGAAYDSTKNIQVEAQNKTEAIIKAKEHRDASVFDNDRIPVGVAR
jgi:hypothetical protein